MGKRGSSIKVPESWLEQCREWRRQQGLSLEETGVVLARATRRSRAFANATVHRYLTGHLVTDELTQAFAKVMKVPHPVQILESVKHRRWCELGVQLDEEDSETFDAELDRLERLMGLLARLNERDANE